MFGLVHAVVVEIERSAASRGSHTKVPVWKSVDIRMNWYWKPWVAGCGGILHGECRIRKGIRATILLHKYYLADHALADRYAVGIAGDDITTSGEGETVAHPTNLKVSGHGTVAAVFNRHAKIRKFHWRWQR